MKNYIVLLITIAALATSSEVGAKAPSKYKYFFTWENYKVGEPKEQAVYIWCGRPVGKGENGFRAVVARLKMLPPGSTVFVFPTNPPERYQGSVYDPDQDFPFSPFWDDLYKLENVRKLEIIFTNVTNEGKKLNGLERIKGIL